MYTQKLKIPKQHRNLRTKRLNLSATGNNLPNSFYWFFRCSSTPCNSLIFLWYLQMWLMHLTLNRSKIIRHIELIKLYVHHQAEHLYGLEEMPPWYQDNINNTLQDKQNMWNLPIIIRNISFILKNYAQILDIYLSC